MAYIDSEGVIHVPEWEKEYKRQQTEELLDKVAAEIILERYAEDPPGEADTDMFLLQMIRGENG